MIVVDQGPVGAAVIAAVEAVLVAATVERPRSAVAFPHRSKENVGILRIKNDVDAAGAVVQVENFLPGFAAIAGAENSALGVFAVGMAQSGDEGDVGIGGMNDDLADVARVFQPNVVPGLAGVVRTVNTITEGDVATNAGFARADINDIGIGVRDRDAADGGGGL